MFECLFVSSSILSNCNNYPNGEEMKKEYLDFYKSNIGYGRYCTKSWGLASYEAGAASRQGEIDDLLELNRLYKIALQQSVNRTSSFVHEKIISLESKIKGQNNG